MLPRVRLTVWAPEGKSVRWRRIFSLQGWELIRKADEEDSSVALMTKKKKKQFGCLSMTLSVYLISKAVGCQRRNILENSLRYEGNTH